MKEIIYGTQLYLSCYENFFFPFCCIKMKSIVKPPIIDYPTLEEWWLLIGSVCL